MRSLLLLFCLATAFHGYAQVPEKFRKNRKSQSLPSARFLVKLAPLAAIDAMSFPTITAGVELHLAPQFSMYNEVGIRYRRGWPEGTDTQFISPGGFKLKSEFRYYFKEGNISYKRFHGHYIAMNGFFTDHKFNNEIEYNSKNGYSLKDGIGITKKVWGINALWGWQDDIGKHFMFEVYEGIGIRIRNYKTVNQQYNADHDEIIEGDETSLSDIWQRQFARRAGKGGSSAAFNYTTGIRLVYKIY